MVTKVGRKLYLSLALVCFAGIIAVFIADGYLGVRDTLYITHREYERKVEGDYWQRPRMEKGYYVSDAIWGEPVLFRYQIENRTFSTYKTTIEVSVWKGDKKVLDLFSKNISVAIFDEVTANWTLSAQELEKASLGIDEYGNYTVKVSHGGVERKIILGFHYPKGPLPPPPPPR